MALELGPKEETGFFQGHTWQTLFLDAFFLSSHSMKICCKLITQELGHTQRLDGFNATQADVAAQRTAMVNGPDIHFSHRRRRYLPNPGSLMSNPILGLLTRSAQLGQLRALRGVSTAAVCAFTL